MIGVFLNVFVEKNYDFSWFLFKFAAIQTGINY